VVALVVALGCCYPAFADDSSTNLVRNASFAEGLEHWVVETAGTPEGAGRIGAGGCPDRQCLELASEPGDATTVKQSLLGLVPGGLYRVSAQVHASKRQRIRLSLHNPDWKGPQCARKPLTVFVERAGTDDWVTLRTRVRVPERDPCNSTRDHVWQLEVTFEALRGARPGVLLNDLAVVPVSETRLQTGEVSPPLCAYFRDYEKLDPCPGTASSGEARLTTVAKWMLDEGRGSLIHDYVAGNNGVVEVSEPDRGPLWSRGAVFFEGGQSGSRVRVDAGQPIAGESFEISLEVSPASDFVEGCLLASQPEGTSLGGFRLCLSQAGKVLRFEMSDGTTRREYASVMAAPLQPERFTSIRVRGHEGVLEIFVAGRRIKKFRVPRLRLRKSPYPFVIGAGVKKSEAGFRGEIRNVTLRDTRSDVRAARDVPLGFVSRGSWALDEGAGIVIHDRSSNHHGLIETSPKRRAPDWRNGQLHFAGTASAAGVMVRGAGPLYGNDFKIQLEAMFDQPETDYGTIIATNAGRELSGGFSIFYRGGTRELSIVLVDGERQVKARVELPFAVPAHEWIPIQLRFVHDQLEVTVAGVVIDSFDFPGFELAAARRPLLIGAYYYPPGKGIAGSIRNVSLLMRSQSIVRSEGAIKAVGPAEAEEPCRAKPLRETMIVGSDILVPNWLGATCSKRLRFDAHFEYIFELPSQFELVASGASRVENGKVIENKVKKLGKGRRDGVKTRRYRVELSYRSIAGGTSGFGPLFIRSKKQQGSGAARSVPPRMYFQAAARVGLEEPSSVALEVKSFPVLPRASKLHNSLAWMELRNSMSWPDFLKNYGGVGFNVVPTLALNDGLIAPKIRSKFLTAARRKGFGLLVLDSPYHPMVGFAEARSRDASGVRKSFINPAYRGPHYWDELDRIAARHREVKPDWYMMNIECFLDGAYACLVGNAPECTDYLAANAQNFAADPAGAVTDLGVELISNIREKLQQGVPQGELPRMGMYHVEPDQIYTEIFDFNKLYDDVIDFAQPVIYRQPPDRLGARLREIRARMPRGDIIPWMDPGTVVEFPSVWVYDRVLEVFGSGASGIAWFAYTNFEGADFYHLARAMEAVIPVEAAIVGSEPMAAIEIKTSGVSATGLSKGPHHVLLLSDYSGGSSAAPMGSVSEHRQVVLQLPVAVRGTLWDLARKQPLGEVEGREIRLEWSPGIEGARTALYYVGPAPLRKGRFEID
jgi:hypothetical protein